VRVFEARGPRAFPRTPRVGCSGAKYLGMLGEAVKRDAAGEVLPLGQIAARVLEPARAL